MLWVYVVNCFQISIFAVHEQQRTPLLQKEAVVNCFQISIFAVHEQPVLRALADSWVVNCFQISIFAVHEQPAGEPIGSCFRCELLSN